MKKTKRNFISKEKIRYLGIHLIIEFWKGKIIEDPKKIKKILITAVKKSKNTLLKIFIHKFQPQGISGVVLLAESHICFHSWPEKDYLAIDIFTCGKKSMPYESLNYLKKQFQPKKIKIKEIKKGAL